MSNVIDFDAFRAEQQAEPITLRIGGKDYELASSLPASLALDIVRMNAGSGGLDEVSEEYLETVLRSLLGDHYSEIISENRITLKELPELIKMVFAAYGGGVEATVPNREARRAGRKSATRS